MKRDRVNAHRVRESIQNQRWSLICVVLFALLVFCSPALFASSNDFVLKSPNGSLQVHIAVDHAGKVIYAIHRGTQPVLLASRLGLEPDWVEGSSVTSVATAHHSEVWRPLYGERDAIPDIYNQLTLGLAHRGGRDLILQFRAYDEGIALRYGALEPMTIEKEATEFHLPAGSFAYQEHGGTEGEYSRAPVGKIEPLCQTPLTIELPDGLYAALLEAANVAFPQMTVGSDPDSADTLSAELGSRATLPAGAFTPWRLVMVAATPGALLEHNYLELDLNARQVLKDVAWIKPGTAMREMTLSTAGAYKAIDFAAAHHIQYIGFDDGWYGPEDYATGDATHERTRDKLGRPAPLNIRAVVRYGRSRGIGVWVYVDHRQAEKQRDTLFTLYEKWGLAGVKIGFVDVGSQQDTEWIAETVRKAAAHRLLLDIHDQYRTTGYTRTYPNLLTVEGIRGNEHFPTPEHDATIPFTRYLAGSADYTICYYTDRLKNTHAHQLAMSVVSYSPLQWIFWYDSPSDYHGEPEIAWFEHLPTVWNETRVPLGEIGKYAVIARRSHSDWYVAAIGNSQSLTLHLALKFLRPGVIYDATLYSDDATIATATHVAIAHRKLTSTDALDLVLAPRGGEAIYMKPEVQGKD